MVNRSEINQAVEKLCKKQLLKKKDEIKDLLQKIFDKYNIPISLSSDIITMRVSPESVSDFICYAIIDILSDGSLIPQYYNDNDVIALGNYKYETPKIAMPIRREMIQVSKDQWIGTISLKELMRLRDAQLIRYNENAQRTLTRMVYGDEEYYKITINQKAVRDIIESLKNETFIANTITLNVSEIGACAYNSETKMLEINAEYFDILDGYHRYVAMSMIHNLDANYDFNMELRIVEFPEHRARQFIWQEDQKTRLSKVESHSLNQENYGNKVAGYIHANVFYDDLIKRNGGIIDEMVLSQVIDHLYFANTKKKYDKGFIMQTTNNVIEGLNALLKSQANIFNERWDPKYITCAMVVIADSSISSDEKYEYTNKLYEQVLENNIFFNGREISVTAIKKVKYALNKIHGKEV